MIKPGDHVFHRPSRETWIVRAVHGDYLEWFGWPPGRARLADCRLVYVCMPDEHERFVAPLAAFMESANG